MRKSELAFPSADGKTKIHAVRWRPEQGEIAGIVQISHGMIEYVERYEHFAEYLTEKGFIVVGNDHLGHGRSVASPEDWGYFAPKKGSDLLVEDLNRLRSHMQKKYPGLPYFMLGHSMGSFLLRKYLSKYGKGLAGAIIMGTGTQKSATVTAGKALCRILALFKGWRYRSPLVDRQVFSENNKRFLSGSTNSWLTKDAEIVKAYHSNPFCTFKFTLNGFYNLFDTIHFINRKENIRAIPSELPVFIVSGEDDPVGNYGVGVKCAYETYRNAGIKDISCKLYPGDRHEILNETDKELVYEDIYKWLCRHL
ncbi:alpha/beta hydrolase [Lachnospiraceae bacterium 45-W7]